MISRNTIRIITIWILTHTHALADDLMQCVVTSDGKSPVVSVTMPTPHPSEMTVLTPDGRKIWLQADHIPHLYPATDDFENLSRFTLDSQTGGSWFNDWGEPEIVPILGSAGNYRIQVDSVLESRGNEEPEHACDFSLPDDKR